MSPARRAPEDASSRDESTTTEPKRSPAEAQPLIQIYRWNTMPIQERVTILIRQRLGDAFPEPSTRDPDMTTLCGARAASLKHQIALMEAARSRNDHDDIVLNAVVAEYEARRSFLLCRIFRG